MLLPRRVRFCRLLVLGMCALAVGCFDERTAQRDVSDAVARNVIVISLDTVRADHLGAYGYDRPTSVAIDNLAARGTVFRNAVAVSPWTRPSNTTLLTGVYPVRHGARSFRTTLSPDVPTLAEIFAREGFRTAGIVSSDLLAPGSGLGRGFASYQYIREWHEPDGGPRRARNPGNLVTDRALDWLSSRDDRRFFLFLHYYDAHSNYAASEKYQRMFDSAPQRSQFDGSTAQLMQVLNGKRKLTGVDLEKLVALYDAEIRQLDDEIQRLLGFLDDQGLRDSTLIVVTSDHGEEFMEHGGVLHARTYYSEVIDIPLIMSGPGVHADRDVDCRVSLIDIAPTLLSRTGFPIPQNMVGVDVNEACREPGPAMRERLLFAEADHSNRRRDQYRMVLGARYKLIFDRFAKTARLFDVLEDPAEQTDISAEHPDVVRSHLEALKVFESGPDAAASELELSAEQIEALRELGYTE